MDMLRNYLRLTDFFAVRQLLAGQGEFGFGQRLPACSTLLPEAHHERELKVGFLAATTFGDGGRLMMPPKMLMRMASTDGSPRHPVRPSPAPGGPTADIEVGGSPCLMASMVDIARPAPLTRQAMCRRA